MNKHPLDLGRITRETLDQLATARNDWPAVPDPAVVSPKFPGHLNSGEQQLPSPLADDPSTGIPLPNVPERWFNPDHWNELVSACGGRQAALGMISSQEDGMFVLTRRRAAEQPGRVGAAAREQERLAGWAKGMVDGFRASLIGGERIATGMQPPSIDRVAVPGELCSTLVLDFVKGTAKGGGYEFRQIRVFEANDLRQTEPKTEKQIAAWLGKRREQRGSEAKKILAEAARRAFGNEFSTRAFDAAYRRVYQRKRGRPRRPLDKKPLQ